MKRKTLVMMITAAAVILVIVFLALMAVYRTSKGSIMQKNEVGVLEVKGVIMEPDDTLKKIKALKDRDSVKAVIVRIDSPGGGISAAQEIYHELKGLDKVKPVIASFSTVAASGGYYVALGARSIFANEGSLTGSIGVIMQLANLERLFQFIKVSPITIKSGKFKDIGSSSRPMTPEEKVVLQELSDNMHMQFKQAVSTERKLPMSAVNGFADGRVFSGQQALKMKLVDFIGTFGDAVDYAEKTAKIGKDTELYYPQEDKEGLLQNILSNTRTLINGAMSGAESSVPQAR